MITFRNRIERLIKTAEAIVESDENYISDLIELKKVCDDVSDTVNSMYDDIVVDINK